MKAISVFSVTASDLTTKTHLGGILTLLTLALALLHAHSQLHQYLHTATTHDTLFDDAIDDEISATFNISLHHLPCRFAEVRLTDALGGTERRLPVQRHQMLTSAAGGWRVTKHWTAPTKFANTVPDELYPLLADAEPVAPIQEFVDVQRLEDDGSIVTILIYSVGHEDGSQAMVEALGVIQGAMRAASLGHLVQFRHVNCSDSPLGLRSKWEHPSQATGRIASRQRGDDRRKTTASHFVRASCDAADLIASPTVRFYGHGKGFEYVGSIADVGALFEATRTAMARGLGASADEVRSSLTRLDEKVSRALTLSPQGTGPNASSLTRIATSPRVALGRMSEEEMISLRNDIIAEYGTAVLIAALNRVRMAPATVEPSAFLHEMNGYFEGCELQLRLNLCRVPSTVTIVPSNEDADGRGSVVHRNINMTHTVNGLLFGDHALSVQQLERTVIDTRKPSVLKRLSQRRKLPTRTLSREEVARHVHQNSEIGLNLEPLTMQTFTNSPQEVLHHFVKVVPSTFRFDDGSTGSLYPYSVSHRRLHTTDTDDVGPGVFFYIDVSALRLVVRNDHRPLSSIITSSVSFLGGLITLFGMLEACYSAVSSSYGRRRRRLVD